jgi:hypothetical protein
VTRRYEAIRDGGDCGRVAVCGEVRAVAEKREQGAEEARRTAPLVEYDTKDM